MFILFFLLHQVVHLRLQLAHLGVEVYLLVTVLQLDVFAGHKIPAFLLDFIKDCRIAIFWLIVILFITLTLPIMEVFCNLLNLLRRELDVFRRQHRSSRLPRRLELQEMYLSRYGHDKKQ